MLKNTLGSWNNSLWRAISYNCNSKPSLISLVVWTERLPIWLNFNLIGLSKMFSNEPRRWGNNWSVARDCQPNLRQVEHPSLRVLVLARPRMHRQKTREKRRPWSLSKTAGGCVRKCFKWHGYGHFKADYPNGKVMTLQEIEKINIGLQEATQNANQIESKSEEEDEIIKQPNEGELLVIRRSLQSTINPKADKQRKNIFQTYCTINRKVCILIIDAGSCTNVALTTKLNFPTSKHS